jgi:GNAT superfamily N-acetyltransferase
MNIELTVSRNIHDYKSILTELVDDFGYNYYPAILIWCGILDDDESDKFWKVYIVKLDGKTVGTCGLYSLYENVKELWLAWFGIFPEYRNKGIGAQVLDLMKQEAYSVGCETLKSYVDKDGKPLPFYYRNGFKLVGTVGEHLLKHPELSVNSFEDTEDFVIETDLKNNIFLALAEAIKNREVLPEQPFRLPDAHRPIDPKDFAILSENE